MTQNPYPETESAPRAASPQLGRGCLDAISRNAAKILLVVVVAFLLFSLARAAVYKIRPYERGLHLRGGRFVAVDQPGWHIQFPFVDTVIKVMIIERSGTIDQLAAMTADDVTMDISLLYTYRVVDPVRYQLEVLDPDNIVRGHVQGVLRDLVNTRPMDEVMHSRADFNQAVMAELRQKEGQYGVEFILVQIQNASPPGEVVSAIKNKMVAVQLQEQAAAEASQQRTLADSEFYAAQKQAEGEAYQLTTRAEAEAQQIRLSSEAQLVALQAILQELEGRGDLAQDYIQVLIAQELRENSKWIISDGESMPVINLEGEAQSGTPAVQAAETP